MQTVVSKGAQLAGGIARNALIKYQPECFTQAAWLSAALSSRLAAAKASAC
jgi:hypothetical protein